MEMAFSFFFLSGPQDLKKNRFRRQDLRTGISRTLDSSYGQLSFASEDLQLHAITSR